MTTVFMSYVAVSPQSHKRPMDISEPVNEGKICACLASGGSCGQFNSAVWVDLAMDPSGSKTEIGEFVG
jgi:hypothetical protein